MDKYRTSFKNAYAIAEIEKKYSAKRSLILKTKKKYAVREEDILLNEENKIKEIYAAVPSDVAARWKKVNDNPIDFVMAYKYGLDKTKISEFKAAYNNYAIKEFKILSNKKLSNGDKYSQLKQLNDEFVGQVSSLFTQENYTKWEGWWKYDFQRKMKRKGFAQ